MAEESMKNKGGAAKFSTSLNKGLNTDMSPETQPDGTYRWALNAVAESEEGNVGFLTNEEGNYICGAVDPGWVIIGHVYIGKDEAIIFQAPTDNSVTAFNYGWGRISRIKSDCTIVNVITASCLDYRNSHQIQATYRIRKGCENTIYYTDDYNKVGYINIDALEDYLAEGQEGYIANNPTTYMDNAYNGTDPIWDCDKLNMFPNFSLPCIGYVRTDNAGSLISGVYQFAVQYLDQDLNESRWTSITQPIPIYKDVPTNALSVKGDKASQVNQNGTVDETQTNKNILLNFSNLDTSYSYIRVAVIPSTQGVGAPSGAYIVDTVSFTSDSIQYSFDGLDKEETTLISLDQITIPKQTFKTAKTITQLENRLVLGNVEDATVDHIAFTKAALDIQVTYVTRELNTDDPGGETGGESVQSGRYYFDYRSYMRDEIYAFGIVWVFKDGTESPVYHIPGREIDKKADGSDMIAVAGTDPNVPHSSGYNASFKAQHNRELPIGTDWDSTVIWDSATPPPNFNMNVEHYDANPATPGLIQRWEVYNTALRTEEPIVSWSYPGVPGVDDERKLTRGEMSYYECRNSAYPDSRDCEGIPIFPHTDLGGGNYEMAQIRHHKMPDTTLEPHFYGNNKGEAGVGVGTSGVAAMGDTPHDQYNMYDDSFIVTLGIEVANVKIPELIAEQIQGYRIVKAIASNEDKTVIDKGIIFNIHYAFNSYTGNASEVRANTDMCAYAFQGNRFNKQLGEFACAHVPHGHEDFANANYLADLSWPYGAGGSGYGNIVADNYYCFEYRQSNEAYGGFTPRQKPSGSTNCNATTTGLYSEFESDRSFSAPLIVNHEWQNWHGSCIFLFGCPGIGPLLKDPSGPNPVHDRMDKGVGYPLGNWGWYTPSANDTTGTSQLRIAETDGVNIGYNNEMIAYPNSSMGYHGPMSKFSDIKSAIYVKTERVLIGYTQNIICNNACCQTDVVRANNPEVLDGVGELQDGRLDGGLQPSNEENRNNGTTYIYTRMSYWQSAVPYTNPSQTFDNGGSVGGADALVGTRMQWQRWSNPCSYQPWSSNEAEVPAEWAIPNTPGTGHRGQTVWQNQSDRYSKPLQNVRLTDYTKVDAYIEEVGVIEHIVGPGPSFLNRSGQEVLLMGFSWANTAPRVYWAWPWPGNNYSDTDRGGVPGGVAGYENYTRIPFDHAYSRFNCAQLYDRWENSDNSGSTAMPPYAITGPPEQMDETDPYYDEWYNSAGDVYKTPLNGAATTYYVSVKKNAYDAYGSLFALSYTLTHNCIIKAGQETPNLISSAEELYGGDSFISRLSFKQTHEGERVGPPINESGTAGCPTWPTYSQPLNTATGYGATNAAQHGYENLDYGRIPLVHYANFNNIVQYWTESYINTELRLGNDVEGERIYPYHFEGNNAYQGTMAFVDDAGLQDYGWPYARNDDGTPYTGEQGGEAFETYPNYYELNRDYNKAAVESTFAPLPIQFDYCQDCSNKHPHRVVYSEASINNEQADSFKTFLTGNFRDIPGNRGEIWNLWVSNNILYLHTAESLWRVDPSRNMMQPEGAESAIYIGTGAFFSSPAREIAQSELGYLGSRSQWATMLTETGTIWPDEQQGHIYMQQEGPGDIGNKGMKAWFETNMPINMYSQYREIYGVEFPFIDNPANSVGAGYTAVFDSEYKRYIVTKKDYKLIGEFTIPGNPFYRSIELDPILNEWVLVNNTEPCNCPDNPQWEMQSPGTYTVVTFVDSDGTTVCKHTWNIETEYFTRFTPCERPKLTGNDGSIICSTCGDNDLITPITIEGNPGVGEPPTKVITNLNEVFECNSWTISYSVGTESWVSFHSYMPNYYIGMRHYFYTTIPQDISVYRHKLTSVRRNYQTFYGCTHPYIIDFINNDDPLNVNIYDSLRYYANVSYYDASTGKYTDDRYTTFDRALLYNSYQTTGELTLKVKDEDVETMMQTAVNQQTQTALLKRKDRVWFANHFRDIAIDRTQATVPSLFTESWADLQAFPYIDKVINPLAIDDTKAWYTNQPLKDRYLQVRLFFDNLAGIPGRYKITTNFILGSAQQTFR